MRGAGVPRRGVAGLTALGTSNSRGDFSPRRGNERRSATVISGRERTWGVRVMITSVSRDSVVFLENSRPSSGMSERPGIPLRLVLSVSLINPASTLVSPSRSLSTVVTVRLLKVGRSPKPAWLPSEEMSSSSSSETSPSWWTRGVMSMLTPIG